MHYIVIERDGTYRAVAREEHARQSHYVARRISHAAYQDCPARTRCTVLVGTKSELISSRPDAMQEIVASMRQLDAMLAE